MSANFVSRPLPGASPWTPLGGGFPAPVLVVDSSQERNSSFRLGATFRRTDVYGSLAAVKVFWQNSYQTRLSFSRRQPAYVYLVSSYDLDLDPMTSIGYSTIMKVYPNIKNAGGNKSKRP